MTMFKVLKQSVADNALPVDFGVDAELVDNVLVNVKEETFVFDTGAQCFTWFTSDLVKDGRLKTFADVAELTSLFDENVGSFDNTWSFGSDENNDAVNYNFSSGKNPFEV
jgi:hypothetical protein